MNLFLNFQVNCGFEMLRTHIPSAAKHKKMSKVDTLKHAVEYIQTLNRMLNRCSADSADSETDDDEIQEQKKSSNQHTQIKIETPMSPPPEPSSTVLIAAPPSGESSSQTSLNHHGFTENYESGYDTSSYYSSSCNSMISPVPSTLSGHEQGYQTNHSLLYPSNSDQHYMELNSGNPDYKYLSGNHVRSYDYHCNNLSIEPNSEEDELLDAIANWQDA